jgi:hypothetical protein
MLGISSIGSPVVPYRQTDGRTEGRTERQTDMITVIVACLCFEEATKLNVEEQMRGVWFELTFFRADISIGVFVGLVMHCQFHKIRSIS